MTQDQTPSQPGALPEEPPRFMAFSPFDSADEMHAGFHRPDASCQDGCTPVEIRVLGAHPSPSNTGVGPTEYGYNPAHKLGTCGKCGKKMTHNVPRMGDAGGWVHLNGGLDCSPTVTGLTPEGYRLLNDGEVIEKTDQFYRPSESGWVDCTGPVGGLKTVTWRNGDLPVRRRLSASTAGAGVTEEAQAAYQAVIDWLKELKGYSILPGTVLKHEAAIKTLIGYRAMVAPTKDQA